MQMQFDCSQNCTPSISLFLADHGNHGNSYGILLVPACCTCSPHHKHGYWQNITQFYYEKQGVVLRHAKSEIFDRRKPNNYKPSIT